MSLLSNHLKLLFVIGIVMLAGCSGAIPSETPSIDAETPDNAATDLADGTVEVHYINVGQSVSTLIIGPDGETMLVDSGHYNDDGEYVLQYLQRHDITRIDHLVSSHNDADHIGGNAAIIDHYEERVIESVTYEAAGCEKCVQHQRNPAKCGFGRRLLECGGYRNSTAV